MSTPPRSTATHASTETVRKALLTFGVALIMLGVFTCLSYDRHAAMDRLGFDFSVNWVAAERLVDGKPLYDMHSSRLQAVRDVDARMRFEYDSPFNSFIGPPVTALLHAPFTVIDHDDALLIFRVLSLLGIAGAVVLASLLLPRRRRGLALTIALGAMLTMSATLRTFVLGQGHALIMLALLAGIWGAVRSNDAMAGVGFGIAAVLKMSPALLLVYLALHRRWRSLGWAAASATLLSILGTSMGRPDELITWLRDVAPNASTGTANEYNQALPAWLARVFHAYPDVVFHHPSIGAWRLLAVAGAIAAVLWLWRARRGRPMTPLDLSFLILVIVVAGPLAWDHYAVWALIPIVFMADARLWCRCTNVELPRLVVALGVAVLFLQVPIDFHWAASLGSDVGSRVASGPTTVGLLIMAGACWFLVGKQEPIDCQQPLRPDPGSTRNTAASSLTATS